MREQDLNLAPQQWKDSAIKRGHRLRVALDDKILLDARIAELEARELGWLTTLSTMELEKRELEAENQRLREAGRAFADRGHRVHCAAVPDGEQDCDCGFEELSILLGEK